MSAPLILIVEDERIVAEDLKTILKRMDYGVADIVKTGELAIQKAGELHPDLILMDIHLASEMDGITAAGTIKSRYDIPVIFVTAFADKTTLERAKITEPYAYLIKPFEERELQSAIEISLYKHATDQQLRQNQASVTALLNATKNGLFLVQSDEMILAINETMAQRTGIMARELVNKPFQTLYSLKAISARMVEEIEKSLSGTPQQFDEEFSGKWFENHLYQIADAYGNVIQTAVYSHDVTDRKLVENELSKLNDKLTKEKESLLIFQSALDEMGDLVIFTAINGEISYVNHAFEKKAGYTLKDLIGKHISILQDPDDKFALPVARFIEDMRTVWTGNITWKSKLGIRIPTSLKSTPIIKDNRALCRVFVLRERI